MYTIHYVQYGYSAVREINAHIMYIEDTYIFALHI